MGVAGGPHTSFKRYGIGFGPGSGGTPQISGAQGNCARFQVGIKVSLPWFDAVSPGNVVEHVNLRNSGKRSADSKSARR